MNLNSQFLIKAETESKEWVREGLLRYLSVNFICSSIVAGHGIL